MSGCFRIANSRGRRTTDGRSAKFATVRLAEYQIPGPVALFRRARPTRLALPPFHRPNPLVLQPRRHSALNRVRHRGLGGRLKPLRPHTHCRILRARQDSHDYRLRRPRLSRGGQGQISNRPRLAPPAPTWSSSCSSGTVGRTTRHSGRRGSEPRARRIVLQALGGWKDARMMQTYTHLHFEQVRAGEHIQHQSTWITRSIVGVSGRLVGREGRVIGRRPHKPVESSA